MNAEDVDVGVLGDACLDVGVEFDGELFAFLGGFGHVHRFGALGFRHREELFGLCCRVFSKSWVPSVHKLFDIQMIRLSGRQDFKICLARSLRQIYSMSGLLDLDGMIYIGHLSRMKRLQSC